MLARRIAVAGCCLAVVAAMTGCSTSGQTATNGGGYVSGDGSIQLIPAGDRRTAPDLSGPLVGGESGGPSSYRGKVVVLNVWASWCGPCRKESPALVAAASMLPGVAFMGINTRDTEGNAEAFVRSEGIPYPSFSDQDGSLVLAMQRVVNMSALPITVILDKHRRVAAAIYGPTTAITLKEIVTPLERES